ncbi:hypothetical protein [Tardiphaga robiniae]|uniref:hypothetical protein n=1 Tax=Tardiphaga robiniae TaxID=943830 RepID=UPI001586DC8B|nr:hypothetical protein [Tardiphaga robiniae]NUU40368.1 hypothetical protein [Tardiphaga robiniae]
MTDNILPPKAVASNSPNSSSENDRTNMSLRFASLVVLGAAATFGWTIWVVVTQFSKWESMLETHFAAIVGLPGAAAAAFALVVFLRQTDGPIEFEFLGFKFKGASGQVAMWVICFWAIAGAIKLVW